MSDRPFNDFEEEYRNLCFAIVERAAKDYVRSYKQHNYGQLAELEKFFESQWFYALTDMDGADFAEKIRRKIDERKTKTNRNKR